MCGTTRTSTSISWGYLLGNTGGSTDGNGDIVIRRSGNDGTTWSAPVTILRGDYGGTPSTPLFVGTRLYLAMGKRLVSNDTAVTSPLDAKGWTVSGTPTQDTTWLNGKFTFWSEGQVVPLPEGGVGLMMKVSDRPVAALLRSDGPTTLTFDPVRDFVNLPGADKKFAVQYDGVSGLYWALTNPVLSADGGYTADRPAMVRNTGALWSSSDLNDWSLRKIFLYTPNRAREGFQYFQFLIDGDDLIVLSRTAIQDGTFLPSRGHDANVLSLHRIRSFRAARAIRSRRFRQRPRAPLRDQSDCSPGVHQLLRW